MLKPIITTVYIFLVASVFAQVKTIEVSKKIDKIIVSPHIETTFIKGNKNAVVVESINIPIEKFKIEHNNKTLQIYLEGAKTVTKNKKEVRNGYKRKKPIYKNRVAKVTVTYTSIAIFSLRGEEKHAFKSSIQQDECKFRVYGASEVTVKSLELNKLKVTTYGESIFKVNEGKVEKQKITAYGESKIDMKAVESNETRLTAYGDGTFKFNVRDKLKVNSYGEATVLYKGNPVLKKGIIIGKSTIKEIE